MNQPVNVADAESGWQMNTASPQRALQRCMQQLVHSGVSALAYRQADNGEAGTVLLRLVQLHGFLGEDWPPHGVGLTTLFKRHAARAASLGAANTAVELLRWQMKLELAELMADRPELSCPTALLRPLLQQQLQEIERLCAASLWTPVSFVTSGLARHWRLAHALAVFCQAQHTKHAIAGLEARCLWLHLNVSAAHAERKAALLRGISCCAAQADAQAIEACVQLPAVAADVQLQAAADLSHYGQMLNTILARVEGAEAAPTEQLLTLLYKLAWVSEASGRDALALAWYCAYQLCSEIWFQHCVLPAQVSVVLKKLLDINAGESSYGAAGNAESAVGASERSAPTSGNAAERSSRAGPPSENFAESAAKASEGASTNIWLCQLQLLRQWPVDAADASLPIALDASSADAPRVVSLAAVPLLLSDSFATLVNVSGDWFATRGAYAADLTPLLRELALLEKGAAAVKVWPLEQLCTLLLDLYALAERDHVALPTSLLIAAHADLVRLLDQAAAWQQTSANPALMASLQQWIARATERKLALGIAAPTPAEAAAAQLYQALLVYLRTLTLVVEKPVRLHVDPDNAVLAPGGVAQVAEALKPLLRFVLLDNTSAAYLRRAAHKPLVHTLSIHVRREAGILWIMLEEDNEGPLLTPAQTRQLQRALPREAGPLGCEVHHGQGRWFSFTLQEVSG